MSTRISTGVISSIFMLLAFFVALVILVELNLLIAGLNGIFAGCMVGIVVTYWRLMLRALGLTDDQQFTDVRQMSLAIILSWIAYSFSVWVSFYSRSTGMEFTPTVITALHRYLAIISAILQVTVPDFGYGLFYGRERKILWTSIGLGALVAVVATFIQMNELLAHVF